VQAPNPKDGFPWGGLMVVSKNLLGVGPLDFWKLTFGEFWPLYNAATAKTQKPLSKTDLKKLEGKLGNGNFRRISS
jgi:hypothetical protein